jgi:hypothetical protein
MYTPVATTPALLNGFPIGGRGEIAGDLLLDEAVVGRSRFERVDDPVAVAPGEGAIDRLADDAES